MATVREQLDGLRSGRLTAAQVAADFRARSWPPRRQPSAAAAWGVEDDEPPAPDSWEEVEQYPGLTTAQVAILRRAHAVAVGG